MRVAERAAVVCGDRGMWGGCCRSGGWVGVRVNVSAGGGGCASEKSLFSCLYVRMSAKPVSGERLPCVCRGCLRVCGAGLAGDTRSSPPARGAPGTGGAGRAVRGAARGSPSPGSSSGGRGGEPGLHPPGQPAAAGEDREPPLSRHAAG